MKRLIRLIFLLIDHLKRCNKDNQLELTILINNQKFNVIMKKVTLRIGEWFDITMSPKDKGGKPAPIESGTAEYITGDPEIGTIEEDPADEFKSRVTAVAPGIIQMTASADADLGEGIKTLTAVFELEVLPNEAETLDLEFGLINPAEPVVDGGAGTGEGGE